jgi:acyl transferase domain-containing protein
MTRDIAVVGIVCDVPSAKNVDEFWQLLANGK